MFILQGGIRMEKKEVYRLNEFAELCNVSVRTLQRWDKEGILVANRTPTNRRFYTHEQYLDFNSKKENDLEKYIGYGFMDKNDNNHIVVACGVDKLNNRLIGISYGVFERGTPVIIKEEQYSELIPVTEVYEQYKQNKEVFLRIGEVINENKDSEAFKKMMRKFIIRLSNVTCLENMLVYISDKDFYRKELKKARKGLRRIKKRTHHYFSDEDIDYLISISLPSSRKDFIIYHLGTLEYEYGKIQRIMKTLEGYIEKVK